MRLHPEAPFSHFNNGYQGDRVCSVCHEEEALAWATTHHSMAYRTLYARDRATDEECVGCHVTGYKTETGFQTGDHSSPLRDVTCEACHGPGGPHDGETTDAKAACVVCHDAEHSIAFSLDKGLPLIDHYRANTMSEDAIRERLRALVDGEAEKPLLAFPSGPTTGSQACSECHEEQHAWAQDDPHADAMRHLKGASQDDPACVRCHATPRALSSAGLPEDPSVAGHRTSEGVGCESCHGPGAEHAADPTSTNIVGLGESCPECVIEAICTSCHIPKWDPEWQLAPRLEAIAH